MAYFSLTSSFLSLKHRDRRSRLPCCTAEICLLWSRHSGCSRDEQQEPFHIHAIFLMPHQLDTAKTHLTGLSPKVWEGECQGLCPWCLQRGFPAPPAQPWDWDSAAEFPSQAGNWAIWGCSALKWTTHRCQTPEPTEPIYSQQSWGRKAAVAPGMTINQHEMPALAKWTLSKYLKSSKELWRGRELSGPVARQSKVRTQTRPLGGWGTAGWAAHRLLLRKHNWGKLSRYLIKLTWPEVSQDSPKSCFVGSEKERTGPRGWQWQFACAGDLPANPHSSTWQLWGCWWPDKRLSTNL